MGKSCFCFSSFKHDDHDLRHFTPSLLRLKIIEKKNWACTINAMMRMNMHHTHHTWYFCIIFSSTIIIVMNFSIIFILFQIFHRSLRREPFHSLDSAVHILKSENIFVDVFNITSAWYELNYKKWSQIIVKRCTCVKCGLLANVTWYMQIFQYPSPLQLFHDTHDYSVPPINSITHTHAHSIAISNEIPHSTCK